MKSLRIWEMLFCVHIKLVLKLSHTVYRSWVLHQVLAKRMQLQKKGLLRVAGSKHCYVHGIVYCIVCDSALHTHTGKE